MTTSSTLNTLHDALEKNSSPEISGIVEGLHPSEIADILESLPLKQRNLLWQQENIEQGEILPCLSRGCYFNNTDRCDWFRCFFGFSNSLVVKLCLINFNG
jgi:hypothetical protein